MVFVTQKIYNLPNDILDNIFYKNNLDNKELAQLVMTHKNLNDFIKLKYSKLYLESMQETFINTDKFKNVYEVDIFSCLGILRTDIFQNCKILKLRNCHNVTDVSKLGNIKYLDLGGCFEIKDVSMLGNCEYLDLSNCHKITDVSKLGNVSHLDLSHCDKITNISELGNHNYLSLRGCNKISNISVLKNVYTLDLSYCENIVDISHLSNVYDLDVSYCPYIEVIEPMYNSIIKAAETNLIDQDILFLKNVSELYIKNCYWISDLSSLCNLTKLDIRRCKNILHMPQSNSMKHISISFNKYNDLYDKLKPFILKDDCNVHTDYF